MRLLYCVDDDNDDAGDVKDCYSVRGIKISSRETASMFE